MKKNKLQKNPDKHGLFKKKNSSFYHDLINKLDAD